MAQNRFAYIMLLTVDGALPVRRRELLVLQSEVEKKPSQAIARACRFYFIYIISVPLGVMYFFSRLAQADRISRET